MSWLYAVLALVAFVLAFQSAATPGPTARRVVERWRQAVEQARARYPAVPLERALAVIAAESAGDPAAVNPERDLAGPYDDSVGLFQITDPVVVDYNRATGRQYNFSMLTDPAKNIELGLWNLDRHLRRFGSIDLATRAHNGGAGGTELPATAVYLSRVRAFEQQILPLLRQT